MKSRKGGAPGTPRAPGTGEALAPADPWARYLELVRAAVDLANAGSLGRASILLDLAGRWQQEQKFKDARVANVLPRFGKALDLERLAQAWEQGVEPQALGTVLRFFPGLAPGALLASLRAATQRALRHSLLALLVAHGQPAREAAAEALRRPIGQFPPPEEWYFRRNLLHLLRRISPPHGVSPPGEVDLTIQHSRLGLPSAVVKEAVALLGHAHDDRAEFALIRLLAEVSDMLPIRDAFGETAELSNLAGRVASALASYPTARAHRAIMDQAETLREETGEPMTTLAALGRQDLSGDEQTVDRLVGLMRRIRRSRIAGMLIPALHSQDEADLLSAVDALASTPLPVVRRALEKIAHRFPDQNSGRAAARVLAAFPRPAGA